MGHQIKKTFTTLPYCHLKLNPDTSEWCYMRKLKIKYWYVAYKILIEISTIHLSTYFNDYLNGFPIQFISSDLIINFKNPFSLLS